MQRSTVVLISIVKHHGAVCSNTARHRSAMCGRRPGPGSPAPLLPADSTTEATEAGAGTWAPRSRGLDGGCRHEEEAGRGDRDLAQ